MDDLAPISRLEEDLFYRGYWMLDAGYSILDVIPAPFVIPAEAGIQRGKFQQESKGVNSSSRDPNIFLRKRLFFNGFPLPRE
ncbi:MAG: hypothetical protein KAV45_05885 [Calditrichia bacterium]|nr:hypothetical protein [Calditrichia bacterium]